MRVPEGTFVPAGPMSFCRVRCRSSVWRRSPKQGEKWSARRPPVANPQNRKDSLARLAVCSRLVLCGPDGTPPRSAGLNLWYWAGSPKSRCLPHYDGPSGRCATQKVEYCRRVGRTPGLAPAPYGLRFLQAAYRPTAVGSVPLSFFGWSSERRPWTLRRADAGLVFRPASLFGL
jgi:hypothetical protein